MILINVPLEFGIMILATPIGCIRPRRVTFMTLAPVRNILAYRKRDDDGVAIHRALASGAGILFK